MEMEKEIVALIEEKGPLTGAELLDATDGDGLLLWRTCQLSTALAVKRVRTRYLRLDRRVEGYARLSPSVLREFLTYSVIGTLGDYPSLMVRAKTISSHIENVSRAKAELAYRIVAGLMSRFESELAITDQVCFVLAGDIVYNMAHDVPRPERSTGKLVKGSDMDLVVIVDDLFPKRLMRRLDDAIYQEKYRMLITPHMREEIDYIVKDLDRVREQVKFDNFRHMVACKLLHEGALLYGSERVFQRVKGMLKELGIIKKLQNLERKAQEFRVLAETCLLEEDPQKIKEENLFLFYPVEESEEFE